MESSKGQASVRNEPNGEDESTPYPPPGTRWNYRGWPPPKNSGDTGSRNSVECADFEFHIPYFLLSSAERQRIARRTWKRIALVAIPAICCIAYVYIAWIK